MGVEWVPAELVTPPRRLPWGPPPADLEQLARRLARCRGCLLAGKGVGPVAGRGPGGGVAVVVDQPTAAPAGAQGPLTGEARALLERMVAAIGLDPRQTYLTPAVKCGPAADDGPPPGAIRACSTILSLELGLAGPKGVLLMGEAAVQAALGSGASLEGARGRTHTVAGAVAVATHSPARIAAARGGEQRRLKREAWEDLLLFQRGLSARGVER